MFGSTFEVNGLGQGHRTMATDAYSFHATPGNTAGLDEIFIYFPRTPNDLGLLVSRGAQREGKKRELKKLEDNERAMEVARFEENAFEETQIVESVSWDDLERYAASKAGGSSERHQSWRSHQHDSSRKDEESPGDLYELWRQEQNIIAARLDKELKSRWELDELIEEQLSRYQSHYFKTMVSTSLKDVSNLLMPTWISPHELAAVSWLGDWRPTSILDLVRILAAQNPNFSLSEASERVLSQLTREIRIEEAVIDEEYAEIQATCVLHLPFSPLCNAQSREEALGSVQELFGNINKVISKAQRLRYKVLELVMKKLLNQTDTAEFVVAFAGIQDAIHQFGEQKKLKKQYPTVSFKGSGSSS